MNFRKIGLVVCFLLLATAATATLLVPKAHAIYALRADWCKSVDATTGACITPVPSKQFSTTDAQAVLVVMMADAVANGGYQFEFDWHTPTGELCNECVHTTDAIFTGLNSFPIFDQLQIAGRLPASQPGQWSVDVIRIDSGNFNMYSDVIQIGSTEKPQVKTFAVTVDVSPKVTNVNVDGQASPAGTKFTWTEGEQHSISVQKIITSQDNPGTRYVFTQWSDGITDTTRQVTANNNLVLTAQYKTQHQLTVDSAYGTATGGDWYDEGAKAYAELDTGTVSDNLFYNWVFAGWSDDASGTAPKSKPITMDAPKTATAKWNHEFSMNFYYIIVGVVVVVAALAAFMMMRSRRGAKPSTVSQAAAPQLSGQKKFCGNCHAVLPIEANVCSSCGQPT